MIYTYGEKKTLFQNSECKKKLIINNLKATKASTFKRFEKKAKVLEQNVLFDLFFFNLFFLTFTKTKKFESCLQNT